MQELKRKFVVDIAENRNRIALLENEKLVELHDENRSAVYLKGNIYLGQVNMTPNSKSAFVNIGKSSSLFLASRLITRSFCHSQAFLSLVIKDVFADQNTPLGELVNLAHQSNEEIENSLNEQIRNLAYLENRDNILVSIDKEPISSKPATVTSEIAFVGNYFLLKPFSDLAKKGAAQTHVSNKIRSKTEGKRLKGIVNAIRPNDYYSITIRTAAEGKDPEILETELKLLFDEWETCYKKLRSLISKSKINTNSAKKISKLGCIHKGQDRLFTLIREYGSDFGSVVVNDKEVYEEILDYVSERSLGNTNQVSFHNNKQVNIFDKEGITNQMMRLIGRKVKLEAGKTPPNLVIEKTEAMNVIDVNSASAFRKDKSAEEIAVEVNELAAEEIARQLRLRDMGGIIMVDFIDMRDPANKRALYNKMKDLLKADKAKPEVLPLTKLCLMQITRKRVREVVHIKTEEDCPCCHGKGKVASTITFIETLKAEIEQFMFHKQLRYLNVHVNPIIAAYLNKGLFSKAFVWRFSSIGPGLRITSDASMAFLEYKFYDKSGVEIEADEEIEE